MTFEKSNNPFEVVIEDKALLWYNNRKWFTKQFRYQRGKIYGSIIQRIMEIID